MNNPDNKTHWSVWLFILFVILTGLFFGMALGGH